MPSLFRDSAKLTSCHVGKGLSQYIVIHQFIIHVGTPAHNHQNNKQHVYSNYMVDFKRSPGADKPHNGDLIDIHHNSRELSLIQNH